MTGHYALSPDLDLEAVRNLRLTVRKLPHRPNRWAWDLRDGRDGSWFESMFEFDSHERARQSGLSRIEELLRSVSDATGASTRRDTTEPPAFREAA